MPRLGTGKYSAHGRTIHRTFSFKKYRADYLNDDQYRLFQNMLLADPEKGDVIPDTGGLRKVRFRDERRHKGARGGIRVIYY